MCPRDKHYLLFRVHGHRGLHVIDSSSCIAAILQLVSIIDDGLRSIIVGVDPGKRLHGICIIVNNRIAYFDHLTLGDLIKLLDVIASSVKDVSVVVRVGNGVDVWYDIAREACRRGMEVELVDEKLTSSHDTSYARSLVGKRVPKDILSALLIGLRRGYRLCQSSTAQ